MFLHLLKLFKSTILSKTSTILGCAFMIGSIVAVSYYQLPLEGSIETQIYINIADTLECIYSGENKCLGYK